MEASPASSEESRDAKHVSRLTLWTVSGALVGLVAIFVVLTVVHGRGQPVGHEAGRQAAIDRLTQDATAAGAPTGLFGAKWLMSMNDVVGIAPNAKKLAVGILGETRAVYERQALVTYHFTNDLLLLITVSFLGASTPADFERTQARLASEFGAMPDPSRTEPAGLLSTRRISHFVLQHSLEPAESGASEEVRFYLRGSGNPKSMPKLKPLRSQPQTWKPYPRAYPNDYGG
jgi:hypothetical protein